MEIDKYRTCCGDQFTMYINLRSLCQIHETNAKLCVNIQKPKILVSQAKVGMCERGYVPDRGNKHSEVKGVVAHLGF